MADERAEQHAAELFDEYIAIRLRGERPPIEEFLNRCPQVECEDFLDSVGGLDITIEHHCTSYVSNGFIDDTLAKIRVVQKKKMEYRQWVDRLKEFGLGAGIDPIYSLSSLMGLAVPARFHETGHGRYQSSQLTTRRRGLRRELVGNVASLDSAALTLTERRLQATAEEILSQSGITQLPVDLHRIATDLYLHVQEISMESINGCIVSNGDTGVILINSTVVDHHQRRFTLGHEIGHFLLHRDHQSHVDTIETINDYQNREEEEANIFASFLLIPPPMLDLSYKTQKPSLALAERLKEEFDVSLAASLRRIVRLSDWQSALIVIKDGMVKWSIRSPLFDGRLLSRPRPDSLAVQIMTSERMTEAEIDLPVQAWIETQDDDERLIHEHCRLWHDGYMYSLLTMKHED